VNAATLADPELYYALAIAILAPDFLTADDAILSQQDGAIRHRRCKPTREFTDQDMDEILALRKTMTVIQIAAKYEVATMVIHNRIQRYKDKMDPTRLIGRAAPRKDRKR
jgi:hypothetical protein